MAVTTRMPPPAPHHGEAGHRSPTLLAHGHRTADLIEPAPDTTRARSRRYGQDEGVSTALTPDALGSALRDVATYVGADGWNQPPALFALVPTHVLAAANPGLIDAGDDSELSPVAQDPLRLDTDDHHAELEQVLATTSWPDAVAGCALVLQVVVVPPEAEAALDSAFEPLLGDPDAAEAAAREVARTHPGSRVARLIVGALRGGTQLVLMQLKPETGDEDSQELLTHPDLAPNLVAALASTL